MSLPDGAADPAVASEAAGVEVRTQFPCRRPASDPALVPSPNDPDLLAGLFLADLREASQYVLHREGGLISPDYDLDDLTNDALLVFVDRYPRAYRHICPGSAEVWWVLTGSSLGICTLFTRNRRRRAARYSRRVSSSDGIEAFPDTRPAEGLLHLRELLEVIRRSLTPPEWALFQMWFLDKCTADEVGERLNTSPAAVYARVSRLRQKLRELGLDDR